jgi:hypothetical protein
MIAPHDPALVWLANVAETASESAVALRGALHVKGLDAAGLRVAVRLTFVDLAGGRFWRGTTGPESFAEISCVTPARAVETTGAAAPAVALAARLSGTRMRPKRRAEHTIVDSVWVMKRKKATLGPTRP